MRILLGMNDPLAEKSVSALLEQEAYRFLLTGQDQLLTHASGSNDFAVLIMDLPTDTDQGLKLIEQIRQRSSLPIIIVTHKNDLSLKVDAFALGIDDYIVIPFADAELLARLLMVVRRANGRASPLIVSGPLEIDEGRRRVTWHQHTVTLARREYALLVAFASQPDQVLTRSYLEQVLYGRREEVDSNALEVHVHHLRRKLAPGIIDTVRGVGYRFNAPAAQATH